MLKKQTQTTKNEWNAACPTVGDGAPNLHHQYLQKLKMQHVKN